MISVVLGRSESPFLHERILWETDGKADKWLSDRLAVTEGLLVLIVSPRGSAAPTAQSHPIVQRLNKEC